MKEVICTCCPQGCHLQVDEANDYKVNEQIGRASCRERV